MLLGHRMAAAAAICLPIVASIFGGRVAFTMYASSTWFSLQVTATDDLGARRAIAPTDLARRVGPTARPFLAGADHPRRTYDAGLLRARLADVARLACREEPRARRVRVTLVEREGAIDGPPRTTTAEVACPP